MRYRRNYWAVLPAWSFWPEATGAAWLASNGTATHGAGVRTSIHEVGHTLFLAHAPGHYHPPEQPIGSKPAAHDQAQICLMSYHDDKKYLCGLCLLKLGGRDYLKIRNDGTLL